MSQNKSILASLTGGLSSTVPVLLACCKSGACIGVCAAPLASLFGVSTAGLAASPWMSVLEPLLIALSAVAFTVSYYSLYVLPKKGCAPGGACGCEDPAEKRRQKRAKVVFWAGLLISLGVMSWFQVEKFQSASFATETCEAGTGCCEEEQP